MRRHKESTDRCKERAYPIEDGRTAASEPQTRIGSSEDPRQDIATEPPARTTGFQDWTRDSHAKYPEEDRWLLHRSTRTEKSRREPRCDSLVDAPPPRRGPES